MSIKKRIEQFLLDICIAVNDGGEICDGYDARHMTYSHPELKLQLKRESSPVPRLSPFRSSFLSSLLQPFTFQTNKDDRQTPKRTKYCH